MAYIAFHCLTHLLLSLTQCCSDSRAKKTDVFPLKDFSQRGPPDIEERQDAPLGWLRKLILWLYNPVNWIITALLIIMVVYERQDIEDQLKDWGVPEFWKNFSEN